MPINSFSSGFPEMLRFLISIPSESNSPRTTISPPPPSRGDRAEGSDQGIEMGGEMERRYMLLSDRGVRNIEA
jgi:hypothetical protein